MKVKGRISRYLVAAGCFMASFALSAAWAEPMVMGITEAFRSAQLSMTMGGRVQAVQVREGSVLQKGDLILYLDREQERLEVKRQELLLQDRVRLDALRVRKKTLEAQVAQIRVLLASGAVSAKQVEDEELALQSTVAEYEALLLSKKREQVELDLARHTYERRHLHAPFAGVVTKVLAHVGESIAPNEAAVVLVDVSRVRFVGTFPATAEGTLLQVGQRVTLNLGAAGEQVQRVAEVVFVSPVTDSASGLVEFVAEFDNRDGAVRPGLSGRLVP
ncbi:secretion protein HlyD family protein [Magnetococcus marinus MC-1]|uniref:Secretion protein HlyD family protein n=1 Tax=Magnetococcus marinus (strain ATCC BAA-1437 / JCM 17883 / MC-1) TaxID=156889 RepID=A0L9Q8_MAGMM|nr:efflux RND transporter periplasmic adaptor subunit [Magnetococcus marinus]ABK44701.1 secretion protein HlyD family protein [Magnetococcus marinus MC-1]